MKMIRIASAAIAAVSLLTLSAAASFAQDKMGSDKMGADKMQSGKMGMDKMGKMKMMPSSTVYACKECKMFYSPADAKKMMMKDKMGHKMTKTTMGAATKMGYKMGMMGKMDKMGGKMDKMSGDKMHSDKMMDKK